MESKALPELYPRTLPTLPDTLNRLECETNELTSLPSLPDSLTRLRCNYGLIDTTNIPYNIEYLNYYVPLTERQKLNYYNERLRKKGLNGVNAIPSKEEWDGTMKL